MYIFKKSSGLQAYLKAVLSGSRTLGFVPTMGALHEGHLSLVRKSKSQNSITVCSVFVNPTQFNETSDLDRYPRTPSKDVELLAKVGCDVLFMPTVSEVYPNGAEDKPNFDFGGLDTGMEGAFRPGHFAGVAQVIDRLLRIVKPHKLYMGQKDFQQFVIAAHLIRRLGSPVDLVMVETAREASGLALSSRNQRLNASQKKQAQAIFQSLRTVKKNMGKAEPEILKKEALGQLSAAGLRPEYFEIVNGEDLQPLQNFDEARLVVACTAAWAGEVRLIDNIILKGSIP